MNLPRLAPLLILSACLPALYAAEPAKIHAVAVDKEMLITALEVVDSPEANYPGVWSFGHLVDEAFGPAESRKVVAAWLESWANGSGPGCAEENRIQGRENFHKVVIAPWMARDGYQDGQKEAWLPNLSNAPFRLLAIVNRMDLARPEDVSSGSTNDGPPGGYSSGSSFAKAEGGEARLIYGAVNAKGEPLEGGMTLIFEYGLDAAQRERASDWAKAWHQLGEHQNFDDAYRADLTKLTRLFTDKRPKTETRAAGQPRETDLHDRLREESSSESRQLLRIRSNDGACGKLRELRQFDVAATGLTAVRLPGTPDEPFFAKGSKENRLLANWLDKQRVAPKEVQEKFSLAGKEVPDALKTEIPTSFTLPASFNVDKKSRPVNGFVATVVNNDKQFHWDGWGLRDNQLRRVFSVQTCCGCHCGDTGTEFFHVAPRPANETAELSKFLRTDGSKLRLKDPASRKSFESAEIEDRKKLFVDLLSPGLNRAEIKRLTGQRKGMVH